MLSDASPPVVFIYLPSRADPDTFRVLSRAGGRSLDSFMLDEDGSEY